MNGEKIFLLIRILLPVIIFVLISPTPRATVLAAYLMAADYFHLINHPLDELESLEGVYEFEPWRKDLLERIGQNAYESRDWLIAISAFERNASQEGNSPMSQYMLGNAYLASGDKVRAVQTWVSLAADSSAPIGVFESLYSQQRSDENINGAIQTLRIWLDRQPDNAELNYRLGLLLGVQQPQESVGYLNVAARLDDNYLAKANRLLAALEKIMQTEGAAARKMIAGQAYASLGEWDMAKMVFSQVVQESPQYADAWAFLSIAKEQMGLDGSFDLDKAAQLDNRSVVVQGFQALKWRMDDSPDLALLNYYYLADQDPLRGIWQIELGNTLGEMGDATSALSHFQKAVTIEPENPQVWLALVEFCVTNGIEVRTTALPAARQALTLAPGDPSALDLFGRVLGALGDRLGSQHFF
jgi:tetratricopeptide (TPR) repeat protein